MQIFANYITPLTTWLHVHPHWALFITFLVSFSESLAIVGSVVPGSVTMTAIGILAGSGVMPIGLTFIAAILGAIAGDSASYALGYFYSERINNIWPFSRYPHWLILGKDYFTKHGGKSVLLGRFFGPLRSIIPIIAGMLGMQQWRFLLANIISAIGWAILYVTPGVLIGAASTELSAESASKLFIFILLGLVGLWVLSIALKWLLIRINCFLQVNLHQFWSKSKKHPRLAAIFQFLTPASEKNFYPTAILALFFIVNLCFAVLLIITTIQSWGLVNYNQPVHLLLESIRIKSLDVFFILVNQFISYITLSIFFVSVLFWFTVHKNHRGFIYITSLLVFNVLFAYILSSTIPSTYFSPDLLLSGSSSPFLALNLMFATTMFTFLTSYIGRTHTDSLRIFARSTFATLLILAGAANLYLGIYKLTDVFIAYFAGFTIGIGHWIFYRRHSLPNQKSSKPLFIIFITLFLTTCLVVIINFKTTYYKYTPNPDKFVLNSHVWWNQQQPILPLYRNNRIGHRVSLLNIQYTGDPNYLMQKLKKQGWKVYSDNLFTKILKRASGNSEDKIMPIFSQLFENKKPALIMTYTHNNPKFVLVLRLWQSNYYLKSIKNNIWIGSVHQVKPINIKKTNDTAIQIYDPLTYLLPALQGFMIHQVNIPLKQLKSVTIPAMPALLLIKPKNNEGLK